MVIRDDKHKAEVMKEIDEIEALELKKGSMKLNYLNKLYIAIMNYEQKHNKEVGKEADGNIIQ